MPASKRFLDMIDSNLVEMYGKTSAQMRGEYKKLQELSKYQDSLYKTTPEPQSISQKDLTNDDIVSRITDIVSAKVGAGKTFMQRPLGGGSAGFGGLGLAQSLGDEGKIKVSFDDLIKAGDPEASKQVAINLKNNLDEGNLESLTEIKSYLQDIYNKSDNTAKSKITTLYEDIEQYYTNKANYDYAAQNLDEYLKTVPLEQRSGDLNKLILNKDTGPFSIKAPQLQNNDILNKYAEHRSYKTGDVLYNEEYLQEFVSSPVKSEESLPKQAELAFAYNQNLYVSAKNKATELGNDYEALKNSIEKTKAAGAPVAQEAIDNLGRIKQEQEYTTKLADKLSAQSDYYKFLNTYYPVEYEKKKAQDKQEVYKNTEQGFFGRAGESVYRGAERVASNTLNTLSGLQNITGFTGSAFENALSAENLQPPPLYRAIDVNKDGKLQDSEYLKDESGNNISFDQVKYTTADGESHWNLWSAFEQTLPIATDVGITIALSRGVGAGARGLGLRWTNVAKAARLGEAGTKTFLKSVAPRISTFGNVYATTFPRFYAEELKNFKDKSNAFVVGSLRAGIEAISETIVPETEFFKGRSTYGALDGMFKRLGKLDPTNLAEVTLRRDITLGLVPKNSLSKTKAALLSAPSAIRKTLSGAAQEALEEEASLLGNYFVDKYASSHNLSIEQSNDLTLDNILETYVSGFIPSLFISGTTSLVNNKKNRRDQARWNIANNPNLYLNRIQKQIESGTITREEGLKKTAAVKALENRLADFENIGNIKNLSTLLDDKDLQSQFFNDQLLTEELLNVDVSELSEEQIQNYNTLLEEASKTIQKAKDISFKYQNLGENDKREIISNVFKKQKDAVTDPNSRISSLIGARNTTKRYLDQVTDQDPRKDFIKQEYQDYLDTVDSQLVERLQGFQQMLQEDPSQVTTAELMLANQFIIPALRDTGLLTQGQEDVIPFVAQGPMVSPEILSLVQEELATRLVLSEEEFYEQVEKDLNNPEVQLYQELSLPLAELSPSELESGELDEDAHDHLPDLVKFRLGLVLESHKREKEEAPDQKSSLENLRNETTLNYYKTATEDLATQEEKVAKIREMNKKVFADKKAKTTLVETEDGIKTQTEVENESKSEEEKKPTTKAEETNTSNFKTEEQRKAEEEEEKGEKEGTVYPRELNTEVFDKYRKAREYEDIKLAEELSELENTPGAEEDVRLKKAERRTQNKLGLSRLILEQDNLKDIESALLGFNTEEDIQKNIIDFFNTVEQGTPDYSKARFIDPKFRADFKNKVEELIGNKPSREEVVDQQEGEAEVENPFSDPTEDSEGSEEEQVEHGAKDALGEKAKESQVPNPQKGGLLYELSIRFSGFTQSVVQSISDIFNSGTTPSINVTIQNTINTFKLALEPTRYNRLQQLSEKTSLTDTEFTELKNLLTYNKVQLVDDSFLNHARTNLKKALTSSEFVYSVLTTPEGEVLYFNRDGSIGTAETGVPILNPVRKNPEILKQVQELGIVTSPVVGVRDNVPQAVGKIMQSGKYKFYINTSSTDTVIAGPSGGRFTVQKGFLYLENPEADYPYLGTNTPEVSGTDIFNLVQDFNAGKLDNEITADNQEDRISQFFDLLKRTINLKTVAPQLLFHERSGLYFTATPDKTKVQFKRVNTKGKAGVIPQIQSTDNNTSAKDQLANTTFYKDISQDRLTDDKSFNAMYFEKGQYKFKNFNSYTDYLSSPEFGATVSTKETIVFSENLVQLKESTSPSIDAIQENNPVDTQPDVAPVSDIDATKAGIERRRQEELEALPFDETTQRKLASYKAKDQARYIRELINAAKKTIEGRTLVNKFDAELKLIDPKATIAEKVMARYFLADTRRAYSASQLSDIEKDITNELSGDYKPYWGDRLRELKKIYDVELAALEQPTPAVPAKPKRRTAKERREYLLNNISNTKDDSIDIDPNELSRKKELGNKITVEQNTAAKAWVANHPIFKNTPFIFDQTVAHPEAYAIWSKAGIQLFEGANYAEAYHEAWHEFSQLYLTPEQKEALYTEARKIWGDIPFVQLEENLAEAFRSYALSGGKTFPKELAKYKESKSIFQKIWDFITNLVSDKKTVDNYFGKLYKGNLSQFTRQESNAYFKKLYSSKLVLKDEAGNLVPQSFTERARIVADLDSLFVDVANRVLTKQNASVINALQNTAIIDKIYANMSAHINQLFVDINSDLQEEESPELVEEANFFADLIENLPTIFNYHKKNSTLFDNKVKKNLSSETLDELNSEDTTEGIGSFESSINEFSQKELASDLIINAIRTLPKYENGTQTIHPKLLSPMLGDFESNWNILQRTLQGSNSYGDMYTKLKKISSKYPQFKTLLSYLKDPSIDLGRMSDLSFKNQFYNIFSMPYVDGATVAITNEKDENGRVVSTETRIQRAISLDAVSLRSDLDSEFNFNPGPFKTLTESGSYAFDFGSFFETFPETPLLPAKNQPTDTFFGEVYAQLAALGLSYNDQGLEELKLKDTKEVREALELVRTKLKSLKEAEELVYTPLTAVSKQHTTETGTIKGEVKSMNFFLNTFIEASPEFANDMRYNPVKKKIWIVNQQTFMSKVLNVLNDALTYPTLSSVVKELPHLDTTINSNPRGSWALRYLFDEDGTRKTIDGKPRSINLINFLGVTTDNEGEKLIDTNESLKHYLDIIGLTQGGIEEFTRLSGKNTTRGFALSSDARKDLGLSDPNLSFKDSNNNFSIPEDVFLKHILPILKSEVDTITSPSTNFKFADNQNLPTLSYFKDILSEADRAKLVKDLKGNITREQLEEKFKSLSYKGSVYNAFEEYITENVKISKERLGSYSISDESLERYHFASFIMRVEQFKLFFNHPYFYKNAKDIEKRISAWNAFGSYPLLDEQNIRSLEIAENKPYAQEDAYVDYALSNDIKVVKRTKDLTKINYLVFKDNPVVSETAKNNPNYSKVVDAYTKSKEFSTQDAAAVATMDFYRRAFALSTGLTPAMEKEFTRQNKIWSLYLQLKNADDFAAIDLQNQLDTLLDEKPAYKFTIKKFQYSGQNLAPTGESIPVFHKYSIKPLLPSEAVQNERSAQILEKLMASGADYGVFKSGTKVAETTPSIPLFDSKGNVNTTAKKPGSVDMKYFKEQVLVENKETFKLVFSTQLRKLIYKDATTANEVDAYNLYKKYMDALVNYDKELFMEKISTKEKLVEFIVDELSNKNAADATKDLIKLKEDGSLQYVLDALVDRTVLESSIVASVKNKIIRQKVNGVQRVQFPVSLMSNRKLKYYDLVDGKVTKAETIISFSKNYYPLFNLQFNGQKIGELDASGTPVSINKGLARLNEALNDPEFVKENERALTLSAIRIPGQGYNSMENFTIVEFLPEESGEIILVPDEMVVKSGSDFDIDKLFTYEPFLSNDGVARGSELSTTESLKRKNELEKEYEIKKLELGDYLKERRQSIKDIKKFLDDTGFDKASDIYKEVKKLKAEKIDDDAELVYTGEIDPIEALKRKFEGGESVEDILSKKVNQTKRKERKAKIKQLSQVLQDYSDQKLGFYLSEAVEAINEVKAELAEIKSNLSQVRNGLANNILFNVSDRLTQSEIFGDLITPNSISAITEAAEINAKDTTPDPYVKASYTNIVNPIYQLYVFSLNSYKKSLGTDAKNNVLHSILQKANLYIEDASENTAYILRANRTADGRVTFTGTTDTNGESISFIQGQMISAHVDIEKNDDIATIGLNNVVTPVVNYMLMAGTPFKHIINLINFKYNGQSSILKFSKNPDIDSILSNFRYSTNPVITEFVNNSTNKLGNISSTKLFKNYNKLVSRLTPEKAREELAKKSEYGDFFRLLTFLKMREQSQKMATLSLGTDFDTFSPQNFESFRRKKAELQELRDSKFFNTDGFAKVYAQSIVSEFQIQEDIFDKLVDLFPISANKLITDTISDTHTQLKKVNYDTYSRVFKNDLLYYLFATNTDQVTKYQSLVNKKSEKHIKNMYDSLKSRLANLGLQSENRIFDLVRLNTSEKSSYIRTGLRQTSYDYDINYYREQFENGLNYSHPELDPSNTEHAQIIDDMREFFKAFAVAGIMGTNLNKKFDSYLPLIPESAYTFYINNIVKEFGSKTAEQQREVLADFIPKFNTNHPEFFQKETSTDLLYFKNYLEEVSPVEVTSPELSEADFADEELYYEYTLDKETFDDLPLPAEAQALQEMRPTRDSFVRFADKANLQGPEGKGIILNYIAKKGEGFTVDVIAERASDIFNNEVTPQEVIDFILRYPGGIGTTNSTSLNTYYGFNNPDANPKYDSIRELIQERKGAKAVKPTTPTTQLDLFAENNQAVNDSIADIKAENTKNSESC